MVISKLNELSEKYQNRQGSYKEFTANYISMKKGIQTINKSQEEMKNSISELKNIVEGIEIKLHEVKDQISELKNEVEKNSQKEQEMEKRLKKKEEGLRELQDNMKHDSIHIRGIPEREEEPEIEKLFEKVMMENFSNLMRQKVTQIQEAQKVPNKRNPKRHTPRHIIIKMAKFKDKERILKAAREKQEVTYTGALIRLAADFSTETLQARKEWQELFQVMKSKGLQPRILYPPRLSIKMEGKIRSVTEKKKAKRIHLHQTRIARYAKGSALRRGRKRVRERGTQVQRGKMNN